MNTETQPIPKPARTEPYVAPGAPKSPLRVAIAGVITAVLALLALWWPKAGQVSPQLVAAVAGGVVSVIALWQDRAARREQAAGVPRLAAARAELPPGAVAADSQPDLDSAVLE